LFIRTLLEEGSVRAIKRGRIRYALIVKRMKRDNPQSHQPIQRLLLIHIIDLSSALLQNVFRIRQRPSRLRCESLLHDLARQSVLFDRFFQRERLQSLVNPDESAVLEDVAGESSCGEAFGVVSRGVPDLRLVVVGRRELVEVEELGDGKKGSVGLPQVREIKEVLQKE
jgi:hypothetical protein